MLCPKNTVRIKLRVLRSYGVSAGAPVTAAPGQRHSPAALRPRGHNCRRGGPCHRLPRSASAALCAPVIYCSRHNGPHSHISLCDGPQPVARQRPTACGTRRPQQVSEHFTACTLIILRPCRSSPRPAPSSACGEWPHAPHLAFTFSFPPAHSSCLCTLLQLAA